MKVDLVKVTEEMRPVKVKETVGQVDVYPVQYRDYGDGTVHIQGRSVQLNRSYGFAGTFKGEVAMTNPQIKSLANTDALYHYGALVVSDTLTLITEVGNIVELEDEGENPFTEF